MKSLFAHMRYSLTMNARQPGIWLRVLVVVPLMEVLPLLFLGRAYLESDTQNFFLYTNMVWAFFTAVVIQCLVSIQGLAGGGRLDTFLHSEGSVIRLFIIEGVGVVCGVGRVVAG